jgi:deoxycytidine triphosphate deaminase
MSQLVAQDIAALCQSGEIRDGQEHRPMITPFSSERIVIEGRSAGLSAATYDVRIASDLTLSGQPQYAIAEALARRGKMPNLMRLFSVADGSEATHKLEKIAVELQSVLMMLDGLKETMRDCIANPPYALANTMEDFCMPNNVVGYVVDKSSHARVFVSAFNTFLDPGWAGNLTLELINLQKEELVLKAGDPICQIAFHFTTQPTDRPYSGKYMNQPKRPVPAIFEKS